MKVMLIKSSTKDSLFQQDDPGKCGDFYHIWKSCKYLEWVHYFLEKILHTSQLSKEFITKKVAEARSDFKLLLQQLGVFFLLCVNATHPTNRSHQLLGLKEAFQVLDLPGTHHKEDSGLCKSPPEHPLVGAFAGLPESLFAISLVVLFLGGLFHLVQELSHSELKFRQLLFLCHIGIVDGVLPDLDVKVDPQLSAREPLGRIAVQTDDMLAGSVRGESEFAFTAVSLGEDDLVIRISNFHVHPNLRA